MPRPRRRDSLPASIKNPALYIHARGCACEAWRGTGWQVSGRSYSRGLPVCLESLLGAIPRFASPRGLAIVGDSIVIMRIERARDRGAPARRSRRPCDLPSDTTTSIGAARWASDSWDSMAARSGSAPQSAASARSEDATARARRARAIRTDSAACGSTSDGRRLGTPSSTNERADEDKHRPPQKREAPGRPPRATA